MNIIIRKKAISSVTLMMNVKDKAKETVGILNYNLYLNSLKCNVVVVANL